MNNFDDATTFYSGMCSKTAYSTIAFARAMKYSSYFVVSKKSFKGFIVNPYAKNKLNYFYQIHRAPNGEVVLSMFSKSYSASILKKEIKASINVLSAVFEDDEHLFAVPMNVIRREFNGHYNVHSIKDFNHLLKMVIDNRRNTTQEEFLYEGMTSSRINRSLFTVGDLRNDLNSIGTSIGMLDPFMTAKRQFLMKSVINLRKEIYHFTSLHSNSAYILGVFDFGILLQKHYQNENKVVDLIEKKFENLVIDKILMHDCTKKDVNIVKDFIRCLFKTDIWKNFVFAAKEIESPKSDRMPSVFDLLYRKDYEMIVCHS